MTITHVKELSELKTLINSNGRIAVDFYATWCGPCKRISPEFERLSNDATYQNWTFVKVDVDEAEEITNEFQITQMPTFIFFNEGKMVDRYSDSGLDQLLEKLNKHN